MNVLNQFDTLVTPEHVSPSKKPKRYSSLDTESDPAEPIIAEQECTVKTEHLPESQDQQEDTIDTNSWKQLFVICTEDDYVGYVTTDDEFEKLKTAYEIATASRFVAARTCSTFGRTELTEKSHQLNWPQACKDILNHPYYVLNFARYDCDHGPSRDIHKKLEREKQRMRGEINTKRRNRGPSMKINCPAVLLVKEIALFIEYQGFNLSKYQRNTMAKQIHAKVKNEGLQTQTMLLVDLPKPGQHSHQATGSTRVLVRKRPQPKSLLTTHVLDTALGKPAENLAIEVCKRNQDAAWEVISASHTDTDGRCPSLVTKDQFSPGIYRLRFDTEAYFTQTERECFYPYVDIVFKIENSTEHYHVPLLLSPFGYSTYKGS